MAFYQLQITKIPDLQNKLHLDLSIQPQTASRLIFENFLAERLSKRRGPQEGATFDPVILEGGQEKALRNAAGFVPFKY